MKQKRQKKILCGIAAGVAMVPTAINAGELTEEQIKVADFVAGIATENWEEYGVLPSVAVAQTLIESSLGVNQVRANNLWGLRPGGEYSSYESMESGMYAYLEVLNNGRYDKALFDKSYENQLHEILEGGYYGEDDGGTKEWYYGNCIHSIQQYQFYEYDKELFKRLMKEETERAREEERKKQQEELWDVFVTDQIQGGKEACSHE